MDQFLCSSPSYEIENLDWTESEVKSQNFISFVGDSQFPLGAPVCLDSQDIGGGCARQDQLSPMNSSDSSDMSASLDMERWDLADGEAKSQSPAKSQGHGHAMLCPPPSLDTQEFENRCSKFDSMETSSPLEMECWDLADGEAISQSPVRPRGEAETPPCPPASLDTQEFERRCVERKDKMSENSQDSSKRSTSDAMDSWDLSEREARPRSHVEKILVSPPRSPDNQELEARFTGREGVSSVDSLQLAEFLAPGEEKSQRPRHVFYVKSEDQAQPRLVCSVTTQEFESRWEAREDRSAVKSITSLDLRLNEFSRQNPCLSWSGFQSQRDVTITQDSQGIKDDGITQKDVCVKNKSSEHAEHLSGDTRADIPLLYGQYLVTKSEFQAPTKSAVHTGTSASMPDTPLKDLTPDKNGVVNAPSKNLTRDEDGVLNDHRNERKNQDLYSSSDDTTSPTSMKHSVTNHVRTLRNSSALCRSLLGPLPVTSGLLTNEKDGFTECYELKGLNSEAEDLEKRARLAVQELFPSGQMFPRGKENVDCHQSAKEMGVSTTSKIPVKIEPKFDTGDERCGSSKDLKNSFQTRRQPQTPEVQPENCKQRDTITLGKRSPSVQTHPSTRPGFSSHLRRTKVPVPVEHEQTQEWRCPKASKRLYKKPKQRSLDVGQLYRSGTNKEDVVARCGSPVTSLQRSRI